MVSKINTIVCSATEESYKTLFCEQGIWSSVTIPSYRREMLESNESCYCAIYVVAPISKIVGYAEIAKFQVLEEDNQNAWKTLIFLKKDGKKELFDEKDRVECMNKRGICGRLYTNIDKIKNKKGRSVYLP